MKRRATVLHFHCSPPSFILFKFLVLILLSSINKSSPEKDYLEYKPLKDEIDLYIEYELDDEDEEFLKTLDDPTITEQVLECIMDYLEKESFKQVR